MGERRLADWSSHVCLPSSHSAESVLITGARPVTVGGLTLLLPELLPASPTFAVSSGPGGGYHSFRFRTRTTIFGPRLPMSEDKPLNPRQEEFARLYYAGPDEVRGNATRCYQEAYPDSSYEAAASNAYRLLRHDGVRARIRELREEAAEEAKWCCPGGF